MKNLSISRMAYEIERQTHSPLRGAEAEARREKEELELQAAKAKRKQAKPETKEMTNEDSTNK